MTHRGPFQPRTFCDSVVCFANNNTKLQPPIHKKTISPKHPNPSKPELFLSALPVAPPPLSSRNLCFLCYHASRRKPCCRTLSRQDSASISKTHHKREEKELVETFHPLFFSNRGVKQLMQEGSGLLKEVRGSTSSRNVFWFRTPLKLWRYSRPTWPMGSLGASRRVWLAGGGRFSFPSTLSW